MIAVGPTDALGPAEWHQLQAELAELTSNTSQRHPEALQIQTEAELHLVEVLAQIRADRRARRDRADRRFWRWVLATATLLLAWVLLGILQAWLEGRL